MIIKKLAAGDCIEARCTRCLKVMNHTIVAMVEDRVVRVECNTCRGIHNYHKGKEAKEAKVKEAGVTKPVTKKEPAAPRKVKKDPGAAEREEWEALRPLMEIDTAIPYDMNGKFRVKDLVAHPVFGLGVVELVIKPCKIEVLFQVGKKLLRCA